VGTLWSNAPFLHCPLLLAAGILSWIASLQREAGGSERREHDTSGRLQQEEEDGSHQSTARNSTCSVLTKKF